MALTKKPKPKRKAPKHRRETRAPDERRLTGWLGFAAALVALFDRLVTYWTKFAP